MAAETQPLIEHGHVTTPDSPIPFLTAAQVGYLFIATSAFCSAINAIVVTYTSKHGVTVMEQVFAIGVATVAASLIVHLLTSPRDQLMHWATKRKLVLLLACAGSNVCVLFCLYAALRLLTAGNTDALFYTSTFIAPVMAHLTIKEPLRQRDIVAACVAFVGSVLVSSANETVTDASNRVVGTIGHIIGVILAIGAAISISVNFIATKSLHANSVTTVIIVLANGLMSIFAPLFIEPSAPYQLLHRSKEGLWGVFGLCIGFLTLDTAFTIGLRYAPAGRGIVVKSSELVHVYIFGAIFLRQIPSIMSLLGAACILGSAVFVGLSVDKEEQAEEQPV